MFSLVARYRARPVLNALSFTIRALFDESFISHSVYFRLGRQPKHPPKYSDIKAELSAYGHVTRLFQTIPKDPWGFFATFENEEVAKKLLEGETPSGWVRVEAVTKPPKVWVDEQRPHNQEKGPTVVLTHVPVQMGCTTDDVAALVKTFGSASIVHSHYRGYPLNFVFITMKDQAAADAMTDASITGEGLFIDGQKVFAYYSRRTEKKRHSRRVFLSFSSLALIEYVRDDMQEVTQEV